MPNSTSPTQAQAPDLVALLAEMEKLRRNVLAGNTHRSYRFAWSQFERWCKSAGLNTLPAETKTVLLYLTQLYQRKLTPSTVGVHAAAIVHMHRMAEHDPGPIRQVKELLRAVRRSTSHLPRQTTPMAIAELRRMSEELLQKKTDVAARNRAMLLFGFASALRAASLCAIDLEDIQPVAEGLVLYVREEKPDKTRKGRWIGVPRGVHRVTCPVLAMQEWLARRGPSPGPLFTRCDYASRGHLVRLRPYGVTRVVKETLELGALPTVGFSSHSLRSGFVTVAGENGASHLMIAAQTGHRSLKSVVDYFRRRDVFKSNACAYLGL